MPGYDDSDPAALAALGPFARRSPEEQYLRNRCSYLAPTAPDKLYLVLRILLGLCFNLIFLLLALGGIALLLSQFVYRPLIPGILGSCVENCVADLPPGLWIPPVALAGLGLGLLLVTLWFRIKRDAHVRFLETWSKRLLFGGAVVALFMVVLPVLVGVVQSLTPAGPKQELELESGVGGTRTVGAAAGFALLIAGVFAQLRQAFSSPKQIAESASSIRKAMTGLSAKARLALAYCAGAIIGPALLLALVVYLLAITLAETREAINWVVVAIGAGAVAGFVCAYSIADITTVSLHRYYKRRLSTAFSLKRVRASHLNEEERRRVQVLDETGEKVGVALERDFDRLVPLSETALRDGERWPTLLVCAAANISDPGATPPGRRVTSFTFGAHEIGGPLVGAAPTDVYADAVDGPKGAVRPADAPGSKHATRLRDFTLPAAVAMSGAAISPSMGKMTKRPLTFLLALVGVRLGVWVPNPRWVMSKRVTGRRWRPRRPRPLYLIRELLGMNTVDAKYLYVTDGGHDENLGLVELLRRGCTEIYCFDASGGESFQELGDAIALARSELGVEVHIDPTDLRPRAGPGGGESFKGDASGAPTGVDGAVGKDRRAVTNVVRGTITYMDGAQEARTGTLVYVRNVLTADSPPDAVLFHEVDPRFPHHSTVDQLYTDQKFEAYRALGRHGAQKALQLMQRRDPRRRAR